jgi:Ti-type conjugative transfer relaxase TraA
VAIYHFTAKVIKRSHGRSAVAAAAYRAGERLVDEERERTFDYTYKSEVIHSEIILPGPAPKWMQDRQKLWNAVEAREQRQDAQVAREMEFALPQELSQADAIGLARHYVRAEFVDRGMVADLNIHWEPDNPHAHVMLTMREVTPDGFGPKVREWNQIGLLREWRQHWADRANQRLHELGFDIHIDHRSYRDQGVEFEPTSHLGRAVDEMRQRGEYAERAHELEEVRERNARKIEQRPELVLEHLTRRQSTFTRNGVAREIFRYIDDGERFRNLMVRIETSRELVLLAPEVQGRGDREIDEPARYTTREMLGIESRLAERALELAQERAHGISKEKCERVLERHDYLSEEQREAVRHITGERAIEALTGFAGSGKSAAITAARELWEEEGYRVWGTALSGIAAENLEKASGVRSRTIASLELGWTQGRERLHERDVVVLDEAGMVGSRQMERIVSEVQERGAKLVLVGDAEQLQPIEAGAAFRVIAERVGYRELAGIRRQHEEWQREASRDFARGEPGRALELYREHDAIHFTESREQAKDELIRLWADDRAAQGAEKASLILAHTRADVRDLNERARDILKERNELGREITIGIERELLAADGTLTLERGERSMAEGERVMFLKNDRELGVKNGSLGRVLEIEHDHARVQLDGREGRAIEFSFADYASLDYGYAATVHKAQGATVERSFVLATPGMDRHLAYVGLTRHREGVELFAGHDDFLDFSALEERLSRARLKDFTLDYAQRRGLELERESTPFDLRLEAERELERKSELLRVRPELAFGRDPFARPEQERTINVFELGRELERQLPEFDLRVVEKERERNEWLERSLGEQGGHFRDWAIPERELQQAARELIGGVALERAERELTQARERHDQTERELSNHRWETGYRHGLERVVHAIGDLHREKRLVTHERQAALELDLARERCESFERWLGEPAQRDLIHTRAGELRSRDQQLLREVQRERGERDQVREMCQELARCPEQERELKLEGRSLEFRELQRDAGLQRDLSHMREQRLAREQELTRGREIERRGITPLREFQRDPQHGREPDVAEEKWARHAAAKGLGQEHIRDELVKDRQRSQQLVQERELERLARLAEREVKRARSLERDRGLGWSR